jgi:ribosomal protein S18 acetylase RimI-like enzyme
VLPLGGGGTSSHFKSNRGNLTLMAAAVQIRSATYHLRPSVAADERFLLELYAQSRAEELMQSGMDALQREVFVQMQFRIRQAAYGATRPTTLSQMICANEGTALGRILTDRTADGLHLVDIAIAPERQRQGIGTQVIQELQRECMSHHWKMTLQVLKGSSAERLYKRLGFRLTGEDLLRRQMVWDGTKI